MHAIKVPTIAQQELRPCNAPLWREQDIVEMMSNYFESFASPTMGEVVVQTETGALTVARRHHFLFPSRIYYRLDTMFGPTLAGQNYDCLSHLVFDLMVYGNRLLRWQKQEEAVQALHAMSYSLYERLSVEAQDLLCDHRLWTFTGRATPEGYHDSTCYNA